MGRLSAFKKYLVFAVIALTYLASAEFGLSFAIPGTNATPLWPPAGIALAAMLMLGWKVWPAILAGAILANTMQFARIGEVGAIEALGGACAIALGNLLEALVAYYLCLKCMGQDNFLKEVKCVFKLVPIAGIACLASASVGSLTMVAANQVGLDRSISVFVTWWLGDVLAILVLTPFLTSFWPLPKWDRNHRWLELASACLTLLLVCFVIFSGTSIVTARISLLIPVLVWFAFRLTRRELLSAVVFISIVAIFATAHGKGPFASESLNESILSEQIFCATIALVMLVISVLATKNAQYRESLQKANAELEAKVLDRTAELERQARILKAINNQLIVEARERSAVQKRLQELESR